MEHEFLLGSAARQACSAWHFADTAIVDRFTAALRHDLEQGIWDARYSHLRTQPVFEGSPKLVIGK